jgi:HEAT repeat protein
LCFAVGPALAKMAGTKILPEMIGLLGSPEHDIQVAAAEAVRQIGPGAQEAVPTLVAILAKNDPQSRIPMMYAMIGIGPGAKAAVPALLPILDCDDFHSQYWAQRTLGAIGPESRPAVPKLIELLHTSNVSVRHNSAIALGAIGPVIGPEGLKALEQALDDRMEPVREDAVIALGKLGDFAKPAAPAVRRVLQTRKIAARVPAARTLWILTQDAEATVPVLIEALKDPNAAIAAAEVLGEIGPPADQAVPALSAAALRGEPELREAAIQAVGRIKPEPKTSP